VLGLVYSFVLTCYTMCSHVCGAMRLFVWGSEDAAPLHRNVHHQAGNVIELIKCLGFPGDRLGYTRQNEVVHTRKLVSPLKREIVPTIHQVSLPKTHAR
jgi:hypothetical protein